MPYEVEEHPFKPGSQVSLRKNGDPEAEVSATASVDEDGTLVFDRKPRKGTYDAHGVKHVSDPGPFEKGGDRDVIFAFDVP